MVGLGAADLTPDDDHRFDLDGVYDIAAENPDRWAVEELAATIDIVEPAGRVPRHHPVRRGRGRRETRASSRPSPSSPSKPEIGSLGLGVEAFVGRSGEDAWIGVGGVLDDLWEDVVEELSEHLDWTGAGTADPDDYPAASEPRSGRPGRPRARRRRAGEDDDLAEEDVEDVAPASPTPGVRTIARGSRLDADPAAVAEAAKFWEAVGILPVEIVVPEGAGVTLRCYVEDIARFLGRDGEIFLFDTPADLARSSPATRTTTSPRSPPGPRSPTPTSRRCPADQDRYDLTELAEVLREVADGAARPDRPPRVRAADRGRRATSPSTPG